MTQPTTEQTNTQPTVQQQAGKLLSQVAGYVGLMTMEIGLRHGLYEEIANKPEGITSEDLARARGLDPFYVNTWCRSAYAAETLELTDSGAFTLAPHVDRLLLDQEFPGYIGGMPRVMTQPEMFRYFSDRLPTGQRLWWDECSPEWIGAVSSTGRAFYNRLIPDGLSRVPGLPDKLSQGVTVLELACGAGIGLAKMAQAYPQVSLVGLDGDAYTLEVAQGRLKELGIQDKVSLLHSGLEELDAVDQYDVAINNISMHECRDIEKATANIYSALKGDGYFVISDFPFPGNIEDCRTVPARIMSGIQFFEALIDDQLLPPQFYVDLLTRHGFRNVGTVDLTPVHAMVYGQK